MENFENFGENYYPKDISSEENVKFDSSSMHKNTSQNQNLSFENISKLLGENENLISLLLSNKLKSNPNLGNLLNNPGVFNSLSSMFGANKSTVTSKKEKNIDSDYYESY